ncbi:hypothetical protein B0A48_02634 [Cryoendolithus antarcticus]|uniref:F-box domain-containing protein n=1 Tax=Cryoendolithus antarcticus TaxID=1507870 RepID=A0A1V8TKU7_9PEZI|nr:hypothetical protein B0A48_02634 [Cryoendolithus antarcticus]
MAKPKTIAPKDPKQTRLLSPQPTPPITRMISQYGMLVELYKYMSSADIVNLAATCREHRKYISSNPTLLSKPSSTPLTVTEAASWLSTSCSAIDIRTSSFGGIDAWDMMRSHASTAARKSAT